MKNVNIMLGVNTKTHKCCVILSNMTFGEISRLIAEFPEADLILKHNSTNWSGCDDISRACKVKAVKPTGNVLKRNNKIYGVDYDHGHKNDWTFEYDEIWETVTVTD